MHEADRRIHHRAPADLACKLLRPAIGRYLAARTADVSAGGALLEVLTSRPVTAGEDIEIGVCWAPAGVLTSRDLAAATVVRAGPVLRGSQLVAVRFAQVQAQAQALVESTSEAAATAARPAAAAAAVTPARAA